MWKVTLQWTNHALAKEMQRLCLRHDNLLSWLFLEPTQKHINPTKPGSIPLMTLAIKIEYAAHAQWLLMLGGQQEQGEVVLGMWVVCFYKLRGIICFHIFMPVRQLKRETAFWRKSLLLSNNMVIIFYTFFLWLSGNSLTTDRLQPALHPEWL